MESITSGFDSRSMLHMHIFKMFIETTIYFSVIVSPCHFYYYLIVCQMMQNSACCDFNYIIIYYFLNCSSHVHLNYIPGASVDILNHVVCVSISLLVYYLLLLYTSFQLHPHRMCLLLNSLLSLYVFILWYTCTICIHVNPSYSHIL